MLRLVTLATLFVLPTVLAASGPEVHADPPALPKPQAIDAAIERGVAWILGEQRPQGTWGSGGAALGQSALAVFTLLHCGLAEDQETPEAKRLRRALRYLDRNGPGRAGKRNERPGTYATALLLLLLRLRERAEDRPRMQRLVDLLAGTQAKNGQWWYENGPPRARKAGDNSNTQFAVLALGASAGEGLTVPRPVLERAQAWWRRAAHAQGGFGYASGGALPSAPTGSMTAAGIACLSILQANLHPMPAPDPIRDKALDYLGKVFSVTRNHGSGSARSGQRQRKAGRGWLHYYLWTVERALVLAGRERIAGRDWYAEGAAHLLDTQKDDGSWRQEHPLYATCFALLFLSRAADPPRAFTPRPPPTLPDPAGGTPVTPRADGEAPAEPTPPVEDPGAVPPAHRPEPTGTVAAWLAEALAPGVLAARCRARGATSLRPLVRGLRHPDPKTRQRAFEALGALLEDARLLRVDRHPLARRRLDLWLRRYADTLVLRDGRFVLP